MSSDDEETGEELREAIDRSQSGAPAAGEAVRDRFSSDEIFQRVVASAEEEVESTGRELFFSGLAAGFAITLTFTAYAASKAVISDPTGLVSALLYPIGFVFIVMGRYQLYTENTLPPVALVLTRVASVPSLLRVWGLVLLGNLLGAGVGAFVLAHTGVLSPEATAVAEEFGREGLHASWWSLFFKAVFAGWLVAGLVWLDHASRDSTTRLLLIYVIIYAIPASKLYHVVVSACDALYLFFRGEVGLLPAAWEFVLPVLLGNTLGGVVLVALVNYAGTRQRRAPEDPRPELSVREWLFGGVATESTGAAADERSE